jgi:hypothetical protein
MRNSPQSSCNPKRRRRLFACFMFGLSIHGAAAAQAPRIGKPRPAPASPIVALPLPPASVDNSLAIDGKAIKARELDTRLNVDVLVDGHGPYRFVVDSGADSSAVGLNVARDLQLPLGSQVLLNGMTSRDVVDRVKVRSLKLGTTTIHDLELPALREADLGSQGLIGIDALGGQRLMMDFETHSITVEDARIRPKTEEGEIVVVARRRRGQLILTRVQAGRVVLDAVIDTGSEFTIGNSALRDQMLRKGNANISTISGVGVTGVPVLFQLARIDELRLGPVILQNVPVAFADVPPFELFGVSEQPALLLGTDVLSAFRRISLDFRARRVRFQLRRCTSQNVAAGVAADGASMRISPNGNTQVCAR